MCPVTSKQDMQAPPASTVDNEHRQAIHDLRNHINALMMNASALALFCKDDRAKSFLAIIETEAVRCHEALDRLSAPP